MLSFGFLAHPKGQEDNTEDSDRKQEAQRISNSLKAVGICSTLTILTQVAFQFAGIVNVLEEPMTETKLFRQADEYRAMKMSIMGLQHVSNHDYKNFGHFGDIANTFLQ
jgi:hypothetical protein